MINLYRFTAQTFLKCLAPLADVMHHAKYTGPFSSSKVRSK